MKIAFGHLHYSSQEFWNFGLREWQACLKGYQEKEYGHVTKPIDRGHLSKLMEDYPDDRQTN